MPVYLVFQLICIFHRKKKFPVIPFPIEPVIRPYTPGLLIKSGKGAVSYRGYFFTQQGQQTNRGAEGTDFALVVILLAVEILQSRGLLLNVTANTVNPGVPLTRLNRNKAEHEITKKKEVFLFFFSFEFSDFRGFVIRFL